MLKLTEEDIAQLLDALQASLQRNHVNYTNAMRGYTVGSENYVRALKRETDRNFELIKKLATRDDGSCRLTPERSRQLGSYLI